MSPNGNHFMPAQIALVHDDDVFRVADTDAPEAERYTVACCPDALAATEALSEVKRIERLITRARLRPGRSNGGSLAMMLRLKKPSLRVIFIASAVSEEHVAYLGAFMLAPVAIPDLVRAVRDELGNNR
jgi:DNA-binding NtrC family response regulator